MKRALTFAVLASLALAGAAYAAQATTFSGSTSQHETITLGITSSKKVQAMHYLADYTCKDSHHAVTGRPKGVVTDLPNFNLSSSGKVDKRFSLLHNTDKIHLVAKISGQHFKGSFHEVYISQGHHRCDSGSVTFDITHQ